MFSRADERLILDLCAPLTNAIAGVGLTEELLSSRERLALAREAERRWGRDELRDDIRNARSRHGPHPSPPTRWQYDHPNTGHHE
jgi:hypothetical protein